MGQKSGTGYKTEENGKVNFSPTGPTDQCGPPWSKKFWWDRTRTNLSICFLTGITKHFDKFLWSDVYMNYGY